MAEGALFSVATNLLSTLGSCDPKKAPEIAHVAKGDIERLKMSVETIRLFLLDAEKQQESSAAVRGWIEAVRDALYDSEDLIDEILTDGKVRRLTAGSKIQNQVRGFFSAPNSLGYALRVGPRLKALSKSLDLASKEIKLFSFAQSEQEEQMSVVTRDRCEESFVDSNGVIGRSAEERDILDFLLKESSDEEKKLQVIAIVGIGGMGKTTLAQRVYNNQLVEQNFQKKWWASVSSTDRDIQILRKICKAMTYESTPDKDLTKCIRESVEKTRKYLLVIDGVWDDNHMKWSERMSLLHNGCGGCRIIVTTRSLSVARAMGEVKKQMLSGLSGDDSWKLFKMIAFTSEKGDDPRRTDLGKRIVHKCSGVPLAIRRAASDLYGRSVEEWEYFVDEGLSKIELSGNVVMSVLKLSYDALPSALKRCFAYCALFPKDFVISKQKLLYLWTAQGYVEAEEMGDDYLKRLLSISFLQKAEQDEDSEIEHYKMHDLVHDLALHVAGDDVVVLTDHPICKPSARHASLHVISESSETLILGLPSVDRLRSCLLMSAGSIGCQQLLVKLQCLRALDLSGAGIKDVPRSIGGLVHLRYLNLSQNPFESLPDSLSKLLNLITLDVSLCKRLKAWPKNFGRLINLQHLSDFKPAGDRSVLEAFSKLKLKGNLTIDFTYCRVQESDNDCWQLPTTVEMLVISSYSGASLPRWREESHAAIVRLKLDCCKNLKRLPALSILRNLKILAVRGAEVLEYLEEETTSSVPSFPCLENLSLVQLPKLKGWSRAVKLEGRIFPGLKKLEVDECPGMELWGDGNRLGVDWDSLTTLQTLKIRPMPKPESLPRCFLQRNVQILEKKPQEPSPKDNNQTSDEESVECPTDAQSHEIPIA